MMDKKVKDAAVGFARGTNNRGRIDAMLDLAKDRLPVHHEQLDRHPFLLNCPNGTVDLRSGRRRPHCLEDFITKLCPTEFCPDAVCPTWERFLRDIYGGDEEIVGFMQRYLGYCLTGDVREQKFVILYGDGSNGKSTLIETLIGGDGADGVLGTDYAGPVSVKLLTGTNNEHPTLQASLFGKRIVYCAESGASSGLNEERIKQITGGDRIVARRMREDFWDFPPTHKLLLLTNHKPAIKGTDHGMWRRIALVPHVVKFWDPDRGESGPDQLRQDKKLKPKLQAEASGILAWLVRGCLQWQKRGLEMPDAVKAATEEYRCEQDIVGRFIDECCELGDGFTVAKGDLYRDLERWGEESGEDVLTKTAVGRWLKQNGYREKRGARTRSWIGLKLRQGVTR
jgi:putative DNA primase/helicase